jgi:uncharacterized protein DUF5946
VNPSEQLEPCPFCGAPLGGRAGCRAAFDELSAASWTTPARGAMHNMLVDVYAMQHPEEYGRSAKSYIRHLSALAFLLEHPNDLRLYWATPGRSERSAAPPIPSKPALLEARGALTVADVRGVRDDLEYQRVVRAWAASVWAAYAPQHALARDYLAAVRRMLDGSAGGSVAT